MAALTRVNFLILGILFLNNSDAFSADHREIKNYPTLTFYEGLYYPNSLKKDFQNLKKLILQPSSDSSSNKKIEEIIDLFEEGWRHLEDHSFDEANSAFTKAFKIHQIPTLAICIAESEIGREYKNDVNNMSDIVEVYYGMASEQFSDLLNQLSTNPLAELFRDNLWKSDEELGKLVGIKYYAILSGITLDSCKYDINLFKDRLTGKINSQRSLLYYDRGEITMFEAIGLEETKIQDTKFNLARALFDMSLSLLSESTLERSLRSWLKSKIHYSYGILLYETSEGKDPNALEKIKLAKKLGHPDKDDLATRFNKK